MTLLETLAALSSLLLPIGAVCRYLYIQLLPYRGPQWVSKILFVLVEKGHERYELGMLAQVSNGSGAALNIEDIRVYKCRLDLAARGRVWVRRLELHSRVSTVDTSLFLPPHSTGWVRIRLPVMAEMTLTNNIAPGFMLFGLWWLTARGRRIGARVEQCGTLIESSDRKHVERIDHRRWHD